MCWRPGLCHTDPAGELTALHRVDGLREPTSKGESRAGPFASCFTCFVCRAKFQRHSQIENLTAHLHSTMTQLRLNSLTVCHVHQELLDLADVMNALIEQFVSRNDTRVSMFILFSKNITSH